MIAFGGGIYSLTGGRAESAPPPKDSLPVLVADTEEKHGERALQKWLRARILR